MKLYNGIPLPALPGYNKSVYTHGFIQYGGVTGMEIYSLIVSTASGVMGDSYTVGEHTYSAWVVAANEQSAANLSGAYPGISTKEWLQFEDGNTVTASTYDNIVWTNTDILKADGSVYLKASKPYDLESFKLGLSLGLCGNALPWKAEPVAWLYGHVAKEGETPTHTIDGVGYVGVVAPDINPRRDVAGEHEKPYATIYHEENAVGEIEIVLCFSGKPLVYDGLEMSTGDCWYSTDYLMYADGKWWGGGTTDSIGTRKIKPDDYIWSSYDILNEGGTVFLAATEPIPIYE